MAISREAFAALIRQGNALARMGFGALHQHSGGGAWEHIAQGGLHLPNHPRFRTLNTIRSAATSTRNATFSAMEAHKTSSGACTLDVSVQMSTNFLCFDAKVA